MFNPKSPLSAAAIFLAGVAAIAYTTLDIQRTLKDNEQPTTPEQLAALREIIDHHDRKAAGLSCATPRSYSSVLNMCCMQRMILVKCVMQTRCCASSVANGRSEGGASS